MAANALDSNADITWTVFDTLTSIARIEIHDGRQSEQDETQSGTCKVFVHDITGDFDQNPGAAYFGIEGKPLAIALWNPVDSVWVPQWRGTIDDVQYVIEPVLGPDGKPIVANIQIECVDVFAYLAEAEMTPGSDGHPPPAGSEGIVFYEDGEIATGTNDPADGGRMELVLDDAQIHQDMYVVFSGNVNVLEAKYDTDSYLTGLREAADAEAAGALGNIYVDKLGRFVFHGLKAPLDPDGVAASAGGAWDFNRWKAGDGTAIAGDADNAQIREISYSRSRSRVVNRAIAYPRVGENGFTEADIPGQMSEDAASQLALGLHSWSKPGLSTKSRKTGGDTGAQHCAKLAAFMVSYYAAVLTRIETAGFKAVHPTDPRATTTWRFICGVSNQDIVNMNVGYPGGTGIQNTDYIVQGRDLTIWPGPPEFDFVDLKLNVSPFIDDTLHIFV